MRSDAVDRIRERLGDGRDGVRVDHIEPDLVDLLAEVERLRKIEAAADVLHIFALAATVMLRRHAPNTAEALSGAVRDYEAVRDAAGDPGEAP